jgi:malto-oligosyltrehalose trehalohydrolase
MPFGAEYRGEATRFSLWAPGCETVRLALGREAARTYPMQAAADGWHTLVLPGVKPGDAYAFEVRETASAVPDPASRSNPWDVHAHSVVVDPDAYEWGDAADGKGARGARRWSTSCTSAPSRRGDLLSAIERLDHLQRLGVTAIELMPVAEFSGKAQLGLRRRAAIRAPTRPTAAEDLKRLVDECHRRGLMVLLDVVYNHFGPRATTCRSYAPQFFNSAHSTPWGAAINFDGEHSRAVRDFFVHNALYWIEEFHLDGLRMDAIHAIADDSPRHIVMEIAEAIAAGPGRERHVHQVLENARNEARLLERGRTHATAQWNDDAHHAFHVLLTGERDGYYEDYAGRPAWHLGRTLAEGFSFQGEISRHEGGVARGEPSAHLPREAFIQFLQNHDQVGNRALGERLGLLTTPTALRLAAAALILAPGIPLLFMGEEFAAADAVRLSSATTRASSPTAVREGAAANSPRSPASATRRRARRSRTRMPRPRFLRPARLELPRREPHARCLEHHRELLALRAREIAPRLGEAPAPGPSRSPGTAASPSTGGSPTARACTCARSFGEERCRSRRRPARLHAEGGRSRGTRPRLERRLDPRAGVMDEALEKLARLHGIEPGYHDVSGSGTPPRRRRCARSSARWASRRPSRRRRGAPAPARARRLGARGAPGHGAARDAAAQRRAHPAARWRAAAALVAHHRGKRRDPPGRLHAAQARLDRGARA